MLTTGKSEVKSISINDCNEKWIPFHPVSTTSAASGNFRDYKGKVSVLVMTYKFFINDMSVHHILRLWCINTGSRKETLRELEFSIKVKNACTKSVSYAHCELWTFRGTGLTTEFIVNKLSFVILWSMNSGLVLLVLDWLDSYSWWESHRFRKWRVLVKFSNLDRFMGKHRYRDRESSNVTSDFYRRRLGRFAVFVFFYEDQKIFPAAVAFLFFCCSISKFPAKDQKMASLPPIII